MKLTIEAKKENPLLQRTEVQARLLFEGATPKTMDVAAAVAKALSTDVPNVVVKKITTTFGKQQALAEAVAYQSLEARKRFEELTSQERKVLAEEKKKAAEAATAAKAAKAEA